jgi:hypothetical protein
VGGMGGGGAEMTKALYAHMNNKTIKKNKRFCTWAIALNKLIKKKRLSWSQRADTPYQGR